VLYALERFRSPALTGWIAFASLAPGLAVSPLAGALLDRMGGAWAIAVDMVASAALLLVLAAVDISATTSKPLLFLVVTLYSLTTPLGNAGVRALIPRLAPEQMLDRANALDTAIYAVVDILGPAVAGVLFGFAGPPATLTVIALLFAAAGMKLRPLAHGTRMAASSKTSLASEALSGLRFVLANPTLRGLAVAYALYQATWGALIVIVPVVVQRHFPPGPINDSMVGALWAGAGAAGAVAALIAGNMRTDGRERALIAAGTVATAIAVYPLCALFGLTGLTIGLIGVGLCAGPIDVGVLSLRQRRTEAAWFGRALSISMGLNMSGLPVGSAIGGLLAGTSTDLALAVAALGSAAAAAAVYRLVPSRV